VSRTRLSVGGTVAALLALVTAVICVRLGFWQLDRLEQRRANNEQARQALALPAVQLSPELLQDIERNPRALLNRRVQARGAYDFTRQVILRGRASGGQPGVHVVTPLLLANSDVAVLVNRGWAPSPDAATVDLAPLREPGLQNVEGLIQLMPPESGTQRESLNREGQTLTVRRLNPSVARQLGGDVFLPIYIQQLPDSTGGGPPFRVALQALDEGPHLGYALQWFSFAIIAVVGTAIIFLIRRRSADPGAAGPDARSHTG
jgi:surfeit locus 1 family protein